MTAGEMRDTDRTAPESMPSSLGRRLIKEQEEWAQFVRQHLDSRASLASISPLDSDRRLYRFGNRIAKVVRRRHGTEQARRLFGQDLEHEFHILSHLDRAGYGVSPFFEELPEWQILAMDVIDGRRFSMVWGARDFWGKVNLVWQSEAAILRLNRAGVCHDDVVANNLLVDRSGKVRIIDFGDASVHPPLEAMKREHVSLFFGRHGPIIRLAKEGVLRALPKTQDIYRRNKLRYVQDFSMSVADEAAAEPFREDLLFLERAWRKAARWNSGRGEWLAYPSLTVAGVHFAGWRPFLLRLTPISEVVDFRGKAVVDLGCNIGLLTSSAMLLGAKSAIGVDADAGLVDAAADVAAAFGVPAKFRQENLDSGRQWEDDLSGADIVIATSIMEWVSDRPRLLRFIGQHHEVLYEGHDPLAVERERLESVGFGRVKVVMMSERGRPVLYGQKS